MHFQRRLNTRAILRRILLLFAPLLMLACASGRGSGDEQAEQIRVTVRNDLRPGAAVTVRLHADGGARHLLGNVPPQSTRSLPVEVAAVAGSYHLSAEATDGRQVRSRSFAVGPFDIVEWSLFTNRIDVRSP